MVVVVTGASAGVGRAVVRRFAREGAAVGLIARGRDGLEGARQDVERLGGRALSLPLDVADDDAVDRAAARVEEEYGPIDIWVNNATVTVFSPIRQMTAEEFRRVTEVTYLGYVHGTLSALRRMLPRDRGAIVQVGSALAYRAIPLQSAYSAAKHAIEGFTESLRCELMHDRSNVRVTMVHLPALNTPQFGWNRTRMPRHPRPVPPIYQPEVAAEAVWHAAHSRRREMKVGYPTVLAVYANRVAPGLLDWHLARTGYESQQTSDPVDPNRPDNLWQPLAGDHGAHGVFDAQATDSSALLWASVHRAWIVLAGALLGGVVAGLKSRAG
jgi:NAD(P)-dependent dehydrogenase (short-subunit alcohol dehydrogenase family)